MRNIDRENERRKRWANDEQTRSGEGLRRTEHTAESVLMRALRFSALSIASEAARRCSGVVTTAFDVIKTTGDESTPASSFLFSIPPRPSLPRGISRDEARKRARSATNAKFHPTVSRAKQTPGHEQTF